MDGTRRVRTTLSLYLTLNYLCTPPIILWLEIEKMQDEVLEYLTRHANILIQIDESALDMTVS